MSIYFWTHCICLFAPKIVNYKLIETNQIKIRYNLIVKNILKYKIISMHYLLIATFYSVVTFLSTLFTVSRVNFELMPPENFR